MLVKWDVAPWQVTTLFDFEIKPHFILVSTGSEVGICLSLAKKLQYKYDLLLPPKVYREGDWEYHQSEGITRYRINLKTGYIDKWFLRVTNEHELI